MSLLDNIKLSREGDDLTVVLRCNLDTKEEYFKNNLV